MFLVVGALIHVVGDMLRWPGFVFRSTQSIAAENVFLRRQLALYVERGDKPRRIDPVTRVSLALLSRFFDWRDALVVVRPETLIRWHRAGWRLFWRLKSRPGRPPIPRAVQALIRRMANENPSWGEERIANELWLKLGIRLTLSGICGEKQMPWRECCTMDERLRFVARLLEGEKMAVLCREFDISRKTGHKIFNRYRETGLEGLTDRSPRPYRQANQLPFQIEALILQLKKEHLTWGAPKIREKIKRRHSV